MHKCFHTILVVAYLTLPSYAYQVKTFTPLTPQNNTSIFQPLSPWGAEDFENTPGENYPKITELEYHLFNKSYEKENIYSRLTRLENKLFRKNFSSLPLANRVDNLLANVDEGIFYGINPKELLKLETRVLGRTYTGDDSATRITRLEKEMLGAMQGGNIRDRFETVKLAAKHYNSYPEIAQNSRYYAGQNYGYYPQPGYTRNTGMGLGGMLQNIAGKLFGDFQSGAITGYTPPIYDPYNLYNPYYGYGSNPSSGIHEYCTGNTGGYYRSKNYGGGSSVHILN